MDRLSDGTAPARVGAYLTGAEPLDDASRPRGEYMLERHPRHTSSRCRTGATNVLRMTSTPAGTVYRSVRCATNMNRPLMIAPPPAARSEERRVGKAGGARGAPE